MDLKLFQISGYAEAILSLRMSKGKFYSWEKAKDIQELVYVVTDPQGFIAGEEAYEAKLSTINCENKMVTGIYKADIAEFKRLLTLTFDNAMHKQKHHTLMKYIDVSFITEGLHRGAQDDLDAHAIAFNNRITRFSTRLAEIPDQEVSEWYQDKVIPFHEIHKFLKAAWDHGKMDHVDPSIIEFAKQAEKDLAEGTTMPKEVIFDEDTFVYTPFGYVLDKFAQVPAKNGLAKDVQRGLMALGTPSDALWKIDLFNLRYVYKMRSKLTKSSPELKIGMERLADQIEQHIPVFGEYFRKEFTSSGKWEHQNRVKTITSEEYEVLKSIKRAESDSSTHF